MKCERCPKAATYHITDVIGEDQFAELHLCEGCAKKHLYEPATRLEVKGRSRMAGSELVDAL